ncbi:MAG TPA: trypsin-like serine protease [Solirubrobacterales bacterium]|jgi:hypothetical protein
MARITGGLLVALALVPAAVARPVKPPQGNGGKSCDAMVVKTVDGTFQVSSVIVISGTTAITHPRRFSTNAVLSSSVRGMGCQNFRELMTQVLLAKDEVAALESVGWRVRDVNRFGIGGVSLHQVRATQGKKQIIYIRRGRHPVLSYDVFRDGQRLDFLESGTSCTAGWVVHYRVGNLYAGITAGHCSNYPFTSGGRWQTEPAVRVLGIGPTAIHTALGSVLSNLNRRNAPNPDAPDVLVHALDGVGLASQEISRVASPVRVTGTLRTNAQQKGLRVCSTGVYGGTRCGKVYKHGGLLQDGLVCATMPVDSGDSGGPVYTRPRNGTAKAVGIVKQRSFGIRNRTCYTPIQTILETLGATFPTGSFAISPPPPEPPG